MIYDSVIIGGGPAGLAAAVKLAEKGYEPVIIESRDRLGGIPLQCIHPGFGLHLFREDLTGPEYIYRFIDRVEELGVKYVLEAYVEEIVNYSMISKKVRITSPRGVEVVEGKTLIYAAGARERTRYEIGLPGPNAAGIYTAGEAQTMMDMYGVMPGKRVLILGSGDVGLIMARRFVLEGAEVVGVVEILSYPSGLVRNIVQCLEDYGIPLYLQHTVKEIRARNGRVSEAVITRVDENFKPIPGSEFNVDIDALILAVGLRPRVKLLKKLGVRIDPNSHGPVVNDWLETMDAPGVFVAGNALMINDYADYASMQGYWAAESAIEYIENKGLPSTRWRRVVPGENTRLVVPQYLSGLRDAWLYLRASTPLENARLVIPGLGREIPLIHALPSLQLRLMLRREEIINAGEEVVVEAVKD